MRTIIGFSERACVSINLFPLYGSQAGLFVGLFFWVGQHDPSTFILEQKLIQYWYNLKQFLSNLSKIIPS